VHSDADIDIIIGIRVGMDLSKVTFPTFVLEPRSMLERITDFMSHPDLIFGRVYAPFVTRVTPLIVANIPELRIMKIQKSDSCAYCRTI
jgi:hypothetical protein